MVSKDLITLSGMGDDDNESDGSGGSGSDTGVVTKVKPKTKKPSMYKVLMLNDDYTPMDFVVEVLEDFFSMNREQATRVMLTVHTEGKAVCGLYPQDIAETKATQVVEYARENQHPLMCQVEKA